MADMESMTMKGKREWVLAEERRGEGWCLRLMKSFNLGKGAYCSSERRFFTSSGSCVRQILGFGVLE